MNCVCNCEPKYYFVSLSVSDTIYTVILGYVKYLVYVVCDRFYRVIFCVLTNFCAHL